MIDYIGSDTPYSTILQYFEPMVATDKNKLLEVTLRKSDDYGWSQRDDDDTACLPHLHRLLIKHYTADYLKKVINGDEKNMYYFRRNNLFEYMKKQLNS